MNKYSANHGLTFHSRVKLASEFASRHSLLFPEISTFSVSGEQPTSQRNIVLNDFKNSNRAIVSNARCLTEGVDVPTIDLVYFCDPKNSKVDIVQAVGRALRKKKGKKLGLVVVPIYHSKRSEVEESISSGSFKNLLQVIRSLCDQDERLQDEINSLAYGKGKRKSSRIEIVSGSFIEEQDTILLEGFEEKLRNSLFDQIVDKTSNNWDLWFFKLKEFLDRNTEYPTKKSDRELYQWVAQQRNRKNNGTLKNEEIRKLNSINFAWNIVEWKWNKQFEIFEQYAKSNEFPPCKGIDDDELVNWYKYQQTCIRDGKIISDYQKNRFLSIDRNFSGPAKRKKWIPIYNDLVDFRKENQNRWPLYDREDKNSLENGLYVFCQTMRKRYRENDLSDYWFDKMTELDFNFGGKTDNWTQYWQEIKHLLKNRESISVEGIGNNAHNWIYRHRRAYEEGKLSEYQSKKIEELKLDRFFETWEQTFEKIKEWVEMNGKLPTRTTQKDYHSWLSSQRSRYKNGRLSDKQIKALQLIGYDLAAKGKERFEEKWFAQFTEYKDFVNQNNREPSYRNESEKQLYLWAAAQRAVNAGNAKNRKPLSQKRIDLLNCINFKWVGEGAGGEESWEEQYNDLNEFLRTKKLYQLNSSDPLWRWVYNQNLAYEKGNYDPIRFEKMKLLGIDLSQRISNSRDGFGKWSRKLREIASFIESNGHYPKAGKGKKESNLYQSLARTKRAFKNNELSEKQLELLKELNIELE